MNVSKHIQQGEAYDIRRAFLQATLLRHPSCAERRFRPWKCSLLVAIGRHDFHLETLFLSLNIGPTVEKVKFSLFLWTGPHSVEGVLHFVHCRCRRDDPDANMPLDFPH